MREQQGTFSGEDRGTQKPKDIRDRTREYALRVIRLYAALPAGKLPRVIGDQILRSGTSVGANYREAIRARSRKEYAAKLNIAVMELEETLYWLEILEQAKVFPSARLMALKGETSEITAILVSVINRMRAR